MIMNEISVANGADVQDHSHFHSMVVSQTWGRVEDSILLSIVKLDWNAI
jgi:hypothetical protein